MPSLRRQLHRRIVIFIRRYLRAARIIFEEETRSSNTTRFSARIRIRTLQERNRGVVSATGKFHPLGTTPFDQKINIPQDGIKSDSGKQLKLEKPEGIVFRSRSYTKFAGQTLQREGFLDTAVRKTFNQQAGPGQILINNFLTGLARVTVRTVAVYFRRAGWRVQIIS